MSGQGENPVPPAIEYLGAGYDIVYGNPVDIASSDYLDPGFRQNIIVQLFDARRVSGSYQEPVGAYIRRAPVCRWDTKATEIATLAEYQAFLAVDVPIQAVIPIKKPIRKHSHAAQPPTCSSSSPCSTDPQTVLFAVNGSSHDTSTQQAASSTGIGIYTNSASSTATASTPSPDALQSALESLDENSTPPAAAANHSAAIKAAGLATCPPCAAAAEKHSPPRSPPHSRKQRPHKPPQHHNQNAVQVAQEAFALSVGFSAAKAALLASENLSFYSRATCVEYIVEFRSFLAPLLTDNFLAGVAMLPSKYPPDSDESEEAWNERAMFSAFIAEFGTHYTHRLVIGGKRVIKTVFSASSVAELEAAGIDVAFAAAFSSTFGDNASNVEGFALRAQFEAFSQVDSAVLERTEWTIGGLPAVNFYAWVPSIPDRAIPIQYTLKPLPELLTGHPDKKKALQAAIEAYVAAARQTHSDTATV